MISRVYSVLGKGKDALNHAEKTMAVTKKHGLIDFDLAYAYECLARSHAALKNRDECKKWYKKSITAGKIIANKNNFKLDETVGMKFNLFSKKWTKSDDSSVNYISTFLKN